MPDSKAQETELLPILPLRNSVVFPASVVPINVGKSRSVRLVEDCSAKSARSSASSASEARRRRADFRELYEVGTVARVVKVIRLGSDKLLGPQLHGLSRMKLERLVGVEPYVRCQSPRIPEDPRARCRARRGSGASLRERPRARCWA